MSEANPVAPPLWLRALGILALAIMGAALVYAAWMGAQNFGRIGV